ncbi:MAG TPA: sigma-70 family RNA polymerase sigma factor [Blastocatellia bacterium]|nr:sigma-70 family RNA polymerase sigma factor [Blastocatellia bacterium]
MESPSPLEITELLRAWGGGDASALEKLTALVYDKLHRIAHGYLRRERTGHSLQSTELINEVWLRLVDLDRVEWADRVHFFALSARLMRRILVDFARSRPRRVGVQNGQQVSFDEALTIPVEREAILVAVDDALTAMEKIYPRQSRVVELRYYGGLTAAEIAAALGVSAETVNRDWKFARAWLRQELEGVEPDDRRSQSKDS